MNMFFLWQMAPFLCQLRGNVQILHEIVFTRGVVPCARQKPPRSYRNLAIGELLQSLPCPSLNRSSSSGARGRGHVGPSPFSYSSSVAKRSEICQNVSDGNTLEFQ